MESRGIKHGDAAWSLILRTPFPDHHRPCLFPELRADAKGRTGRHYPRRLVAMPLEAFKRMSGAERFLKPGGTFGMLDAEALAETEPEAARRVNRARDELFRKIFHAGVA